jgi:hypothetical protein
MSTLSELTQTHLGSLITASINDFFNGYRCMFDKDIKPSLTSTETVPVGSLKRATEGIVALNHVTYTGKTYTGGAIQIILDKKAVFAMGGLTIMLPAPRIQEDCLKGTEDDAKRMVDSVGEVGNLLMGSFSKIFREGGLGVDGIDDEMEMLLDLPVPVGDFEVPAVGDAENVQVFTYQMAVTGIDPFIFRVVVPAA